MNFAAEQFGCFIDSVRFGPELNSGLVTQIPWGAAGRRI